MTDTKPAWNVMQGLLPYATPVRARGVTNTGPAWNIVQGMLPYAIIFGKAKHA